MMGLYPIGSMVELNRGEIGVVVRNHERLLASPVVRLVLDATGSPCDPEEVDLAEPNGGGAPQWTVKRTLAPEEVGIDMLGLLSSNRVEDPRPEFGHGLMHEPAPGEVAPPGFVEEDPRPVR